MLHKKMILFVSIFLVLAFSWPVLANATPTPSPIDLNTPEPGITLALPTGTLEPPIPPTPTDLPKPELYREWIEPTRTPPNRAVFIVGFALAALVVIGMILLGYYILKGRDKSPK